MALAIPPYYWKGSDTPAGHGRRLIVVSNRGPFEHQTGEDGQLVRRATDGGVAIALNSIASAIDLTWIVAAKTAGDHRLAREGQAIRLRKGSRLRYISPPPEAFDLFYGSFCNPLLWFVQHGITSNLDPSVSGARAMHAWRLGYQPVNQTFAEAVARELRGDEVVMFQDYHLYLAPRYVRGLRPGATLQQFIHIPWPAAHEWQFLPPLIVQSICKGLLANHSVVFQTEESAHNFLSTCASVLPDAVVDFVEGSVSHAGSQTRVSANPISVDVEELRAEASSCEAQRYARELAPMLKGKVLLRVDRLDPSKNIIGGFQAFDALLTRHPELVGQVTFLAFLVPSRTDIPEYRDYARAVFAEAQAINRRHGSSGWMPVQIIHENNRPKALAAMSLYDVLLVNSLADGMNLVSKEGPVVNQRDGVLVLSRRAGSFGELRSGALAICPTDVTDTADAIFRALSMGVQERALRASLLREAIEARQLREWMDGLLADVGVPAGPFEDRRAATF